MKSMEKYATRSYSARRILRKVMFIFASRFPFIKGEIRSKIYKLGGVKIIKPSRTFIGTNVLFDELYPSDITVGECTIITDGCRILAHYVDATWNDFDHMSRGQVNIGRNVFLGLNTVIVKPVTIGDGAIIGANSVVTKDIPPYTIWGGNPAVFLKKRVITHPE